MIAEFSSTYYNSGYEPQSFAYNPYSNTIYISFSDQQDNVYLISYNFTSGSETLIYSKPNGEYLSSLKIYNGVLYGVEPSFIILVYNETSNQLYEAYGIPTIYADLMLPGLTPVLRRSSSGLLIAGLSGDVQNNLYVSMGLHDPSTNTSQLINDVNLTELLGLTTSNPPLDFDAYDIGGGSYNLAVLYGFYSGIYYYSAWSMIRVAQVSQPSLQPPPVYVASNYYTLSRLFSWGSVNDSYEVIGFHKVNDTSGYITASSATVVNGVIDNSTLGVAIVYINFTGSSKAPVNATMIIDQRPLMNAAGSLFSNGSAIVFYGYNQSNLNATIAIYDLATGDFTFINCYPSYSPLSAGFIHEEVNSTYAVTVRWIEFIESNGTILNATLTPTSIVLVNTELNLNNLSFWGASDARNLVETCSDSIRNYTVIASIEPNATGYPSLNIYLYNSTGLYSVNLNTTVSFSTSFANVSINGLCVNNGSGIITLYDNSTSTSYMFYLNYVTGGVALIYKNSTAKVYIPSTTSLGLLVGGAFFDSGSGLWEAIIYTINPTNYTVYEQAYMSTIGVNEEVLIATVFNNTFLLGIGKSYASPANLTISGSPTITATPVPEEAFAPAIALITAAVALLYYYRRGRV